MGNSPKLQCLNTLNVCMMVLWRLRSNLSHMGNSQSNCHPGQSLSLSEIQSGVGVGVRERHRRVAVNYGNTGEYTN